MRTARFGFIHLFDFLWNIAGVHLVLVLCLGSLGIRTHKVQCRRTFTAEKFRKLAWQDYNWQKSGSEGTGDRSKIFDYRGFFSSISLLSSTQARGALTIILSYLFGFSDT